MYVPVLSTVKTALSFVIKVGVVTVVAPDVPVAVTLDALAPIAVIIPLVQVIVVPSHLTTPKVALGEPLASAAIATLVPVNLLVSVNVAILRVVPPVAIDATMEPAEFCNVRSFVEPLPCNVNPFVVPVSYTHLTLPTIY